MKFLKMVIAEFWDALWELFDFLRIMFICAIFVLGVMFFILSILSFIGGSLYDVVP